VTFAWTDSKKPKKSARLAGAMEKIHTRHCQLNQSLQYICTVVSITVTRTSAVPISQSTSVCPHHSSNHNSLHASNCHHTHSSIYLHSPSASKVHPVDVTAQSKVRWWASYWGEDPM
jgi:hypothetical protein